MKTIVCILLTYLLSILGCSKKQTVENPLQTSVDTVTIEYDIVENDYELSIQDPALFMLSWVENSDVAFISLSDIYPLNYDDFDSLILPDVKEKEIAAAQYFELEAKYRNRFLSKTKISETDSVFVYDYSKNKLVSFVVKNLKVVAMLNFYASESDYPYSPYDYMIGFEIDTKKVEGFSDYYRGVLVYVGKENPFTQEQLVPIVWEEISAKDYPSKEIDAENASFLKSLAIGKTYLFEANRLQYFLQDHLESQFNQVDFRRLLVVDSKTKDIIIEKIYGRGEGTSPSPLNYEYEYENINQWTGRLFKNKPPVVFGFEYISFGCPFISIIDKSKEDIYIYCDNRH